VVGRSWWSKGAQMRATTAVVLHIVTVEVVVPVLAIQWWSSGTTRAV
jgi:hypothetical protein